MVVRSMFLMMNGSLTHLPGKWSRLVDAIYYGCNLLSKVSDFIDPVTGRWDEELVSQTFWQVDVAQILAIPLPGFDMSDFVAWDLCKNRRFSVRSGYFAEWHNQYGHKISGENTVGPSRNSPIWGTIWSLRCPAKVRIFLWKTSLGSLPCRVTLANRHIKVSGQCPTCGIGAEGIYLCKG